jgi:hypothetical protein
MGPHVEFRCRRGAVDALSPERALLEPATSTYSETHAVHVYNVYTHRYNVYTHRHLPSTEAYPDALNASDRNLAEGQPVAVASRETYAPEVIAERHTRMIRAMQ